MRSHNLGYNCGKKHKKKINRPDVAIWRFIFIKTPGARPSETARPCLFVLYHNCTRLSILKKITARRLAISWRLFLQITKRERDRLKRHALVYLYYITAAAVCQYPAESSSYINSIVGKIFQKESKKRWNFSEKSADYWNVSSMKAAPKRFTKGLQEVFKKL